MELSNSDPVKTAESLLGQADTSRKRKLMVEELTEKNAELPPETKMALHKGKVEYKYQKNHLKDAMEEFYFLQALTLEKLVPEEQQDAADEEIVATTLTQLKDDLDQFKCSFEEAADALETKYEQYLKETKEVLEIEKEVEIKKKKLEETLEDKDSGNLDRPSNPSAEDVKSKIEVVKDQLNTLLKEKGQLNTDLEHTQKLLQRIKQMHSEVSGKIDSKKKWCDNYVSLLSTLTGFKEVSLVGNTWTVECCHGNSSDVKLQISMTFALTNGGSYVLKDTTVSVPTLSVESVVATATERDDVRYLLAELQAQWLKHFSVANEVEQLRKSYAVDWQHDQGQLHLLLGNKANAMVILNIEPGYPQSGGVSLSTASNLPKTVQHHELKPQQSRPTLTNWVEYLQESFGDFGSSSGSETENPALGS